MKLKFNNTSFCIHCTFPTDSCICALAPILTLPSHVHILYHPKEFQRRNSSGRLLKHCFNVPSIQWHRLKNKQLQQKLNGYALLYPAEPEKAELNTLITKHGQPLTQQRHEPLKGYIWLDATWQESRKILKQSPWLNALPKYSISTHSDYDLPSSQYSLRRNQTSEGLSTMETFAYWLYEQNQIQSAQDLLNFFNHFQATYLSVRNSGLFK